MTEPHALLLTDVVDSTALAEKLGDIAMASLWARHDRVARDLLPVHRGREIDKTDGFLLLFEAASDAIHREVGDRRLLRGRTDEARARLEEALVLDRKVGNPRAEGSRRVRATGERSAGEPAGSGPGEGPRRRSRPVTETHALLLTEVVASTKLAE